MTKNATLSVKKRHLLGRKVKVLRKQGLIPANIYGKKIKSQSVTLSLKDFDAVFASVGETNIVKLKLAGDKQSKPCLISNVQTNPVTDLPIHIDFHQVDLSEKVTAKVPLVIEGESPAVKEKGAVIISNFTEIEVEALPTDLPNKFIINISSLKEFGDSILVSDLKVDSNKVEIKISKKQAIVVAQEPKEEKEEEPAPKEEEETPETSEKDKEKESKEESKDKPKEEKEEESKKEQ